MGKKKIIISIIVLIIVLLLFCCAFIVYYNKQEISMNDLEFIITEGDIKNFNNQFIMYDGLRTGGDIAALINTIKAVNKENKDFPVSFEFKGNEEFEDVYISPTDEEWKTKLENFKDQIDKDLYYKVESNADSNGRVSKVVVYMLPVEDLDGVRIEVNEDTATSTKIEMTIINYSDAGISYTDRYSIQQKVGNKWKYLTPKRWYLESSFLHNKRK